MAGEIEMDEMNAAIEYRLSAIERTLEEVKGVVVEDRMQSRDIADLQKTVGEFLAAINAHDKRLRSLEERPARERAEKWQTAVDMVFKAVLGAAMAVVLMKIGLAS